MSVDHQITDGYGLRTKSKPPLCRLRCDQAGMAERNSACTVCLSDVVHIKPKASETYSRAGHCKQIVQSPSNILHTCPGFRAVSHTTHSQTRQHTLWTWSIGLNTDCGLLHQPLWSTVTTDEGRNMTTIIATTTVSRLLTSHVIHKNQVQGLSRTTYTIFKGIKVTENYYKH